MKAKESKSLTSGQIAKQAGVNTETLRYYERRGLLKPSTRRASGYRVYDEGALKKLLFIKRAQELGFTLEEISELLNFRMSSAASREKVRAKAKAKLIDVRAKIESLEKLESTLKVLVRDCAHSAENQTCPILEKMEGSL